MNNKKLNVTFDGKFYQADWILSSNTKYYAGHHVINNTNIFENELVTYIFKDLTRLGLLYSIFLIIIAFPFFSSDISLKNYFLILSNAGSKHGFSIKDFTQVIKYFSIIRLAIGAAHLLPQYPFSTKTETTIFGSSAGAKAIKVE